jgi:COMPASS component SWD3
MPLHAHHITPATRFTLSMSLSVEAEAFASVQGEWKLSISALKFAPNGSFLAVSSADGSLSIFKVDETGFLLVCTVHSAHEKGISDVAWSPDSSLLATASDDKTIAIWQFADLEAAHKAPTTVKPTFRLQGHTSYVYCVAFHPASGIIASGGFDDSVRLWDLHTGKEMRAIPAHADPVTSVAFSHDGTVLLTGSFDGLLRMWDVETGLCLKTIVGNANPPVTAARFSSAASKYITASTLDSRVRLWNVGTGKCIRELKASALQLQKFSCAFELIARTEDEFVGVLSGSEEGCVCLFNLNSQQLIEKWTVFEENHTPILSLTASPDTQFFACAGLAPNLEFKVFRLKFNK